MSVAVEKPRVMLVSHTENPDRTIAFAARMCYSGGDLADLAREVELRDHATIVRFCVERGHHSVLEHASYTFALEGISRACTHQLVRHRIASYSQQSQRYVDFSERGTAFVVPSGINKEERIREEFFTLMDSVENFYRRALKAGIAPEDARFALPNATETKIVVTMNTRSLLHFFRERMCSKAQWEIREVAWLMFDLVRDLSVAFEYAGPKCEAHGWCSEKNGCGRRAPRIF